MLALILLALASAAISAAPAFVPSSGLWWQSGANGKFLQLHIGPGGYAFATLSYDDGSGPTYRVIQGPLRALDPASEQALAEISSPLYRIDNAGCLGCAGGVTVIDQARSYRLRFLSTTSAELRTDRGQLIRYEYYPLYTRSVDRIAHRLADKYAVLRNDEHAALVQLTPTAADPDCGTSSNEIAYRLDPLPGEAESTAIPGPLQSAVLVVDPSDGARARLLVRTETYSVRCVRYLHGCAQYEIQLTGSRCAVGSDLAISDNRLAGKTNALPQPIYPLPSIGIGGEIELTLLD